MRLKKAIKALALGIAISMLTIILNSTAYAKNRLIVPLVGEWDFDIVNVTFNKHQLNERETLKIHTGVKCIKSTNNTGYVRVVLKVKHHNLLLYTDSRDVNIIPEGNQHTLTFEYITTGSGYYDVDIDVLGGAGYLWQFDTTENSNRFDLAFSVNRSSGSESPEMLMFPPEERGRFTVFTFQLNPAAVDAAAYNYPKCEQYVRKMIWAIANEKFKGAHDSVMIAIAIAIAKHSSELFSNAKKNRGRFLQIQFNVDNYAVGVVHGASRLVNALEAILGTRKFLQSHEIIKRIPGGAKIINL